MAADAAHVPSPQIPPGATAQGRAAQVALDGGIHEHSHQLTPLEWGWRAVRWNLHNRHCGTERCFRLRIKAGTVQAAETS